MAPRTKKPPASEVINGVRFSNAIPQEQSSLSVELGMFAIAASKSARVVLEELGTSCGMSHHNSDTMGAGGEDPHESIDSVRETLALGDTLSRISWGSNAMHNRSNYIVATGMGPITIKPKKDGDPSGAASAERVQAYMDEWVKESDWFNRQAEVSQRLDRHGEVFDILSYEEDGILQLQFAEPDDLDDDPKSPFAFTEDSELEWTDFNGVRRTNDLMYKPIEYFIDGTWYKDLRANMKGNQLATVPEEQILILHRKRNVLSRDNRGLTLFWPVRDELPWAKKLLSNLVRKSSVESAFAAIRSISEAQSIDNVHGYLQSTQSGKAGSQAETFNMPAPGITTIPDSIKYIFPDTGKGATSAIEVENAILQACASGLRLPEFMLSSNTNESNFAATLVSEAPFVKGMEAEQQKMVNEDLRILYQVLRWAAEKSIEGISQEDVDNIVIEITPPAVSTRKRAEDFQINNTLHDKKIISSQTLAVSEGYEYESEQAQIATETPVQAPTQLPIPAVSPEQTPPVPAADRNPLSDNPPAEPAGQPASIS